MPRNLLPEASREIKPSLSISMCPLMSFHGNTDTRLGKCSSLAMSMERTSPCSCRLNGLQIVFCGLINVHKSFAAVPLLQINTIHVFLQEFHKKGIGQLNKHATVGLIVFAFCASRASWLPALRSGRAQHHVASALRTVDRRWAMTKTVRPSMSWSIPSR